MAILVKLPAKVLMFNVPVLGTVSLNHTSLLGVLQPGVGITLLVASWVLKLTGTQPGLVAMSVAGEQGLSLGGGTG